jgi:hypothetical protein
MAAFYRQDIAFVVNDNCEESIYRQMNNHLF